VIAGFSTSRWGVTAYVTICVCTLGLGYLFFRWMPRLLIKLTGLPAPLKSCSWAVVEVSTWRCHPKSILHAKTRQNQWGEFTVHDISIEDYGSTLSTVFGPLSEEYSHGYDDDDDPILEHLKILDYRYMRLLFHPVIDKFVLNNTWADPRWTDIRSLRQGLDSDEREIRTQVFGKNVLEIKQRTVPQLLMDEVGSFSR
jgi:cation-transporting P-type ATPase 13A2